MISDQVSLHAPDVASYSSSQENEYFGWDDAKKDTAVGLAEKFLDRFPEIAKHGKGLDWEYAGWYVTMLGHADHGCFPIVFADFNVAGLLLGTNQFDYSRAVALTGNSREGLALPPPGARKE